MTFAAIVLAVLLSGCAGITDVIQKREQLYGAKPISIESPAPAAYALAIAAAKADYAAQAAKGGIPGYVDAGIGLANSNCRAWLSAVSMAEARWRQGEQNIGVLSALISGALAASGVHRDVLTVFGLGSAAWQGYSQAFLTGVLGMSDYTLQVKVREAMLIRAGELRAQAAGMSYPQAVDAIEEYMTLCTPQAAQALSRSALTAVTATVAPSGAITVAPITSAFVKDDSGERIVNYWAPSGTVNEANQARLLGWMQSKNIGTSITFFSHAKLYEAARKQIVAELGIP